jgi:predicted  nucleic acid-binding Zn-ribbon protein
MAECKECGEEYPDRRRELGYRTCLDCGAAEAYVETVSKSKRTAPLFNKGGYSYITDGTDFRSLGK